MKVRAAFFFPPCRAISALPKSRLQNGEILCRTGEFEGQGGLETNDH